MTYFIIRYALSVTYQFLYFHIFLNKMNDQTRCLKVTPSVPKLLSLLTF
jgi:hypothetical protein